MKDKNGKAADNLYGYTSEKSKEAIGKKCYFAFADYTGTSLKKEGTVLQPGTETDDCDRNLTICCYKSKEYIKS